MNQWLDVQTLIWLFPIMFIFHDFEEITVMEKWLNKNSYQLYKRLPTKLANRVIQQFSMTTAQLAVAVLLIFLLVSSSTFMANQYLTHGFSGNMCLFTVMTLAFFLHPFTHLGQSIFLGPLPQAR